MLGNLVGMAGESREDKSGDSDLHFFRSHWILAFEYQGSTEEMRLPH